MYSKVLLVVRIPGEVLPIKLRPFDLFKSD